MLISAIVFGLIGSLHCVGMCGPIAFMLPVDRNNSAKRILQTSLYHFGRMLAYACIGLVFGIIGKSFSLFGFQQQLSIVIGVIMILLVLIPQKYTQKYSLFKPLYKVTASVKNNLGAALKKKSADAFLTIGFLNGFLPCGLVYMAVLGAIATGSYLQGSLYMALFGLGTIPLMTTVIYLGNFLKGKARKRIQKIIPVFVIVIGLLFILRGMGLGIPYVSPKPMTNLIDSKIECIN